jgi:acetylornithine deacetylase/succinyl-diaminopimelate desuccinylase-like protein
VAGHLDTVWAHGTLASMPYRVDGDLAHGPGIFDMKAGSFLAFHVVRSILQQKIPTPHPITLLLTPDEEVGSPTSRALIEHEGERACCVLIVEPANANGACVTARKGVGRFELRVRGIGSHAGGAFTEGASAIVELAAQIGRIHAMVDLEHGVTLNVAPIWGGSRPNVIPEEAGCEIDLRVPTSEDGVRLEQALRGLTAIDPRCALEIAGGMNRPPLCRDTGYHSALRHRPHARRTARHRAAEGASRRRLRWQFYRRPRRADARRAWLPRRRSACRARTYSVASACHARGIACRPARNHRLTTGTRPCPTPFPRPQTCSSPLAKTHRASSGIYRPR